ncbi:hypothetical protein [Colwellia sp. MB3u-55]|uniref:hypothetical protein n=1 Tax=Colwellia sp. MB3u-55 TaxID=2759810 RepID=UPI0015F6B768|nr:hypothetical protein [Colwellia sp. MB3u-55]MBA6253640.1 hypothetical protein [Colwellia sp. MB3u-55]
MTIKQDEISNQKAKADQAIKDKHTRNKQAEDRAAEREANTKNKAASKSGKVAEVDPKKFEKSKGMDLSKGGGFKSSSGVGSSKKDVSAFARTANFNNKTNSNWGGSNQLKESLSHSIIRDVEHSLTEIGKTKQQWNVEHLDRNLIFTDGKIVNMSDFSGLERKAIAEKIISDIDNDLKAYSNKNNGGEISQSSKEHTKIANSRTLYKNKIFKNLPELKQFFNEQKLETKSTKKKPDPKAKFNIQIPEKTEHKFLNKVNSIIEKSNLKEEQKTQYKKNAIKFFNFRRASIESKNDTSRKQNLNKMGNNQNFTQIQEMVFRVPNHNGAKLSGTEQLKAVVDYYKKHFPEYEIAAAVLHGDEANKKQIEEYKNKLPSINDGLEGDHVHIFVKGKNKNTNEYDLRQKQKELYSDHLKKIYSKNNFNPNKKNLNKREQELMGSALQDHFYKHINENLLNKNGFNAVFTNSKIRLKIEADLPKQIREMNLDNFNYEISSQAEIDTKSRELLLLTAEKVVAGIHDIPIKDRLKMKDIKKNLVEDLLNNEILFCQAKKEIMFSKIAADIDDFKIDKNEAVKSAIEDKTKEQNQEINKLKKSQKDEIDLIHSHYENQLGQAVPASKYNHLIDRFTEQKAEITRLKKIENQYYKMVDKVKSQAQVFGKFIISVFKNENGKQDIIDYKNKNNQHEMIREALKDGFNYEYEIIRNGINYNHEILEIGDQKDLINIENDTISKIDDKEILNYYEIRKAQAEKENQTKKAKHSSSTNKPVYKKVR